MKTLFLINTVVWLDDVWQLYSNDHTGKIYDRKVGTTWEPQEIYTTY